MDRQSGHRRRLAGHRPWHRDHPKDVPELNFGPHTMKIDRERPTDMRTDPRRLHRRSDVDGAERDRPDAAGPPLGRRGGRAYTAALTVIVLCTLAGCGGGNQKQRRTTVVSKTFADLADSYVRANHPQTNYGNNAKLFADGSPRVRAYLSFEPLGPAARIVRATLRLYSLATSGDGFQVRETLGQWSEASITYANAPPVGPLVSLSGPLAEGQWTSIDVTAFVRKNPTSVQVALIALGPTSLTLAGRRDSAHAPRLVVDYRR
jgi:hypothetical protein